jgi:putative ABC transport system permease protein
LKPGGSLREARAELSTFGRRIEIANPASNTDVSLFAEPLSESVVKNLRPMNVTIFGTVSLILLSAGTNLMNLGLARAFARTKDTAVRMALGATRRRLAMFYATAAAFEPIR